MRPFSSLVHCFAIAVATTACALPARPLLAQGAADRGAFRAAEATTAPAARLQALLAFTKTYPDSALRPRATELALQTALADQPQLPELVHGLAVEEIADAPAGLERWIEQARVADALAGAEPAGVDLPAAEHWASEALGSMTEIGFRRETEAAQRRYQLPPLTAREIGADLRLNRVLFLAALAHVDLREGKPEAAEPLLAEAFRLNPVSSEVNALRGELALGQHRDAAALQDFERAEAAGALSPVQRTQMSALYLRTGGADGEAGLEAQVDATYRSLFATTYTLRPRTLPAGGHTALLELFTGSGCQPCVAPDLAVDSLLATYRRQDLLALEYDENIPRPDPLTSPASVAQAAQYGVADTPEAFLDGQPLPVAGSTRADVENVVIGFADEIETEAAQPSPVRLLLQATPASGKVRVQATVSLPEAAGGRPAPALPAQAVLHVALVEDHLRYTGENGIRFHRMVVRAMGPPAALHLAPAGAGTAARSTPATQVLETSFDLPTVTQQLRSYLDTYETSNDRYGLIHFLTKDLPPDPHHLLVVAWVQDPATRQVLDAAFAEAGSSQ